MPSPVFHSLAGLYFAKKFNISLKNPKNLMHTIVFTNLPDIDLIPGILAGDLFRYHHLYTHGLYLYLVLYFLCRSRFFNNTYILNFSFFLIFFHLFCDLFSGPNIGLITSYGLPIFSPFSSFKVKSPVSLFLPISWHLSYKDYIYITFWELFLFFIFCMIIELASIVRKISLKILLKIIPFNSKLLSKE